MRVSDASLSSSAIRIFLDLSSSDDSIVDFVFSNSEKSTVTPRKKLV